jgi:hypothetical protein
VADKGKKRTLFADPETKEGLCFDLWVPIFKLHYANIEAANEHAATSISEGISDEEGQQATAIFDNISKGRLPKDKLPDALSRLLSPSP